jgi:hypothetical protein
MKVTGIVTKAVEQTREITIADKKLIMRRRAGADRNVRRCPI